MYTTLTHLQSAIRTSVNKGGIYRAYEDTLNACWSNVSEPQRSEKIVQFAAQNHWAVSFRQIGALGFAAEFQKAEDAAQAA